MLLTPCHSKPFEHQQLVKNLKPTYYSIYSVQTVCLILQDAPHFVIDGKLKDILKVTPGACLQYAVIEGNQAFTASASGIFRERISQ